MPHTMLGLEDPVVKTTDVVLTFRDLQSIKGIANKGRQVWECHKGYVWDAWGILLNQVGGPGSNVIWDMKAAFLGKGYHNGSLQKHTLRAQEGGAAKHSASFTQQVQRLGATIEMLAQHLIHARHC